MSFINRVSEGKNKTETRVGAEYALIVTGQDGNNLAGHTRQEAETEAVGCQDRLIVEL